MTDPQRRSKGNGGKTRGYQHVSKRECFQIANKINAILQYVFPMQCGEGRLMHAILSHTVISALATHAPKRKYRDEGTPEQRQASLNSSIYFENMQLQEKATARRILSEDMWFCEICNVDCDYVRRVVRLGMDYIDGSDEYKAMVMAKAEKAMAQRRIDEIQVALYG